MADFAPGIENKQRQGSITDLPVDSIITLSRQLHKARRAREHTDLRLGTSSGLLSWALPKHMPVEVGDKRLAIRQPIHKFEYGSFQGTIPGGYGKGTVELKEYGPVVVLKATPNHIVFTRGNSQTAPIYSMVATGGNNWLVSIKSPDQPPIVVAYKKEHFARKPIDEIADIIDDGARVRPKIDGASTLLYLGKNGIRAFGTRVGANGMRPEYTAHIGGLYGFDVPKELQGKLIRGELYGVDSHGKSIHPNELSALLHSNLVNAIDKKQKGGIRLLIAALAENKNGVDDYYTGADELVAKLNHPAIHGMPPVTGEAAKRLVEKIKSGKYPLTREGVVLSMPNGKVLKSKNIDDYDVIIRDIFKADTDRGDMAGGFSYSYPDSDEIVGRVGTGFDDAMRKDMWEHPDKYIGQLARVHSQEQLESGVLRAPGFVAMRAD